MDTSVRIAVPIEGGEGLSAIRSEHFGHSAAFALIDVVGGEATEFAIITNPPHTQGGCMTTVNLLAAHDVQVVSAAGMGQGPLMGLIAAGIEVHHDGESKTVGEAVAAVLEGRTTTFGSDQACRGHHH